MTNVSLLISIRREDPWSDDARVLIDECSALTALYSGCTNASRFALSDACSLRGGFLVARTGVDGPVGFGAFRRFNYGVAELTHIYSRLPNAGVGRAMLTHIEMTAANSGYHTVVVNAAVSNRPMRRFLWRMGFEPLQVCDNPNNSERGLYLEKQIV